MAPDATIVVAVGWVLAGWMLGMWLGERGRRKAAERWAETGHFDEAPRAVSGAPQTAEDRFHSSVREAEAEAIERAFEDLRAAARAQGLPISDAQLRQDAERMLAGEDVLE